MEIAGSFDHNSQFTGSNVSSDRALCRKNAAVLCWRNSFEMIAGGASVVFMMMYWRNSSRNFSWKICLPCRHVRWSFQNSNAIFFTFAIEVEACLSSHGIRYWVKSRAPFKSSSSGIELDMIRCISIWAQQHNEAQRKTSILRSQTRLNVKREKKFNWIKKGNERENQFLRKLFISSSIQQIHYSWWKNFNQNRRYSKEIIPSKVHRRE